MSSIPYDKAKELAASADKSVRLQLAQRRDIQPEILYYLAVDEAEEVRRAIAENEATPAQAHIILANDSSEEVRARLAEKVARLLPELPDDEAGKAREYAIQTLELLARDELTRIRAVLSEAIKAADHVPHHLVRQLAHDVELIVSAPVLQFSPLLTDDDLREIVAGAAQSGALAAIARRVGLSGPVSDAIVATRDVSAVAALLANDSAQIREETLDLILDAAPGIEPWHEPLVQRPNLPGKAAKRIAGFVAASLLTRLAGRRDLPADTLAELRQIVEQRLDVKLEETADDQPSMAETEARVMQLIRENKLDNDMVQDAVERGDRNFVLQALVQNGRIPLSVVQKAFEARNGRLITALVWRAKFTMRTAVMIQRDLVRVPPRLMVNARNGTDYPMTRGEMEDQLRILGL
ncbi:MAG TPA: DUF2336 domain-containing protein [Ferrovibrio sp.]|jgi:uncharacterized protein (DUF2336 family)|uniref:DUF2336 domain-containing protein n=1 Tax=Ferrovibrio sp. TaxID=1917215 RepID=UPI002B4AD8D3|nr:DUF2336 domain-containing protein [Ferrovibrio sp.]HLT76619.1 DUF2336 domain-containing protein [Ferrovibrio sp.]